MENKKWKFIVSCYDETSGMDCVEFYCDGKLEFIDYEKPYEWIWNGSKLEDHKFDIRVYDKAGNYGVPYSHCYTYILGIIFNPQVSEGFISFLAVRVWLLWSGEIISFKNFTICKVGFSGYVGKLFIFRCYIYGWSVD